MPLTDYLHGRQPRLSPIVVAACAASMRGTDGHEMALELMARSIAWVLTIEPSPALSA